jgi:hypothetical protein
MGCHSITDNNELLIHTVQCGWIITLAERRQTKSTHTVWFNSCNIVGNAM